MARYVMWPGYILSATDRQRHFIGSAQLRRLYRVPAGAQVVDGRSLGFQRLEDDIDCKPRYDGKYPLYEEDR